MRRARGFWGGRHRLLRTVKETLIRSGQFAYRDRRNRKREFRRLWIVRIGAACRQENVTYSQFINGLKKAGIEVDRKMLADLAVNDSVAFSKLVSLASESLVISS